MIRRRTLRFVGIVLMFLCALSFALAMPAFAQPKNQILFLQFSMKGDTLTLIRSEVRPGIVKEQRSHEFRDGLKYAFRSANGALLLEGTLSDPSVRRYEYEDPENPGRIKSKDITFHNVEFTIRVPYQSKMYALEVYRVRATLQSGSSVKLQKTYLATFVLPPMTRMP